jgi:hypothetical protein
MSDGSLWVCINENRKLITKNCTFYNEDNWYMSESLSDKPKSKWYK